jgi:nucleoside-diphosphate-sugar epimerase
VSTLVVTGACGSLGQRVVALLAADRDVGRIVAIDVAQGSAAHPKVEYLVLDLADGQKGLARRLDTAFDGASGVIHLAWSPGPPGTRGQPPVGEGRSPNLRAMQHVLGAASRAGVKRLVHVSSATVYGAWPDNPVPLAENAAIRPNPGFSFAAEKAEAERMAAEWAGDEPVAILSVLRPAVTVGTPGPALYRALAGAGGARYDDGGRPMQFLHVDDLAAAVTLVWRRRLQGVYNVSPDGWISEDAARTLAGGVVRRALPARLARTLSGWAWHVLRTGVPREALPYEVHPWVIANDRLAAAGWTPAHSNEEALVTADDRPHWDDLSSGRRRSVIVSAVVVAGAGTIGAAAALTARTRRRRRR